MLYNDEVHSYEQVVSTLKKVLVVDDKKSYEYAAIVDKEGRSAIKRSKKSECESIKNKVEVTNNFFFFMFNCLNQIKSNRSINFCVRYLKRATCQAQYQLHSRRK